MLLKPIISLSSVSRQIWKRGINSVYQQIKMSQKKGENGKYCLWNPFWVQPPRMAPNIPIPTHPILPSLNAADLSIKSQTTGIDSCLQHPSSYLLFASFDLWVGILASTGFLSPIWFYVSGL